MYLLTIFSPFISSLVILLFGRLVGTRGASVIAPLSILVSFVLSVGIWYENAFAESPVSVRLSPWFMSLDNSASWSFYFDSLFAVMAATVTLVSFAVHVYSLGYMQNDPHLSRFCIYLSLFTGFMLVLVSADTLIQLVVGWEGIGVVSYLLISFWSTRLAATKSALQAMFVNRVSDTFLIIAIFASWWLLGGSEIEVMSVCGVHTKYVDYICICLALGAFGKSAQLFFHVWLPNSMSGPTPVSALIHAATLVTAGVYLVARTSMIWEYSADARAILTFVGLGTSLVTAMIGLFQSDIKSVIAYSTCSQLGYMFTTLGLGDYGLGVFHLATHAFFKALLFLTAGVAIHAFSDVQDVRLYGGSLSISPLAYALTLLGSLCLVGFPSLSGYYSKDAILELAWALPNGKAAYYSLMVVALFTCFYSVRLIILVFLGPSSSKKTAVPHAGVSIQMGAPILLLAVCAIFIGVLICDMTWGVGTGFWGNAIARTTAAPEQIANHFVPRIVYTSPLFAISIGAFASFVFCSPSTLFTINRRLAGWAIFTRYLFLFLVSRLSFDPVYNKTFVGTFFELGKQSLVLLDKGALEFFGPKGLSYYFMDRVVPTFRQAGSGTVHDAAITTLVVAFAGLVVILSGIYGY